MALSVSNYIDKTIPVDAGIIPAIRQDGSYYHFRIIEGKVYINRASVPNLPVYLNGVSTTYPHQYEALEGTWEVLDMIPAPMVFDSLSILEVGYGHRPVGWGLFKMQIIRENRVGDFIANYVFNNQFRYEYLQEFSWVKVVSDLINAEVGVSTSNKVGRIGRVHGAFGQKVVELLNRHRRSTRELVENSVESMEYLIGDFEESDDYESIMSDATQFCENCGYQIEAIDEDNELLVSLQKMQKIAIGYAWSEDYVQHPINKLFLYYQNAINFVMANEHLIPH